MPIDRTTTLEMMQAGSLRPMRVIASDLATPRDDDSDLAHSLCELVTRRPVMRVVNQIHPDAFLKRLSGERRRHDAGFLKDMMTRPLIPGGVLHRIVMLVEDDVGDSRAVMRFLSELQGMNGVPYLDKLVTSVAKLRGRQDWIDDPATMFDGSFRAALDALIADGTPLRELSGLTNTILAIYEWAFHEPGVVANGFRDVIGKSFDVGFDLGGGFTTPYLAHRFGVPLVCLDLFDPNTRMPSERAYAKTLYDAAGIDADLSAVPYRHFDVYTSSYPLDHESYLITSFGFLGSTPGDVTAGRTSQGDRPSFSTTYAACSGLARLIRAGKRVTLCVYGRPSAVRYHNICYTLWFDAGAMTRVASVCSDLFIDMERIRKIANVKWPFSSFAFAT